MMVRLKPDEPDPFNLSSLQYVKQDYSIHYLGTENKINFLIILLYKIVYCHVNDFVAKFNAYIFLFPFHTIINHYLTINY